MGFMLNFAACPGSLRQRRYIAKPGVGAATVGAATPGKHPAMNPFYANGVASTKCRGANDVTLSA